MIWDNFDWGNISEHDKTFFQNESLTSYNRIFDVEEGDVVLDFGAYVGSFTYGILDRNPEHVWVMEPIREHFRKLYKNLKHHQVSFSRLAISDLEEVEIEWEGVKDFAKGVKFKDFIENNCIDKIDFFKCDCEGGEYLIFNEENLDHIKKNIRKIVIEFHLQDQFFKNKFRYFRDNILKNFENFYVFSVDGTNIKWDLYNEHFINYYNQILIHIDNRK